MSRRIVVGDIHGCADELSLLMGRVGLSPEDTVIAVGDAFDRGPKPSEVYTFFSQRPRSLIVLGNHERKHIRGLLSPAQEATRASLGASYPAFVGWLSGLSYFYEDEQLIVVHAALEPGRTLGSQRPEVLSGTMSGERYLRSRLEGRPWYELYEGPKPVVFGHKVVGARPLIRNRLAYGIDTGACHGGWLTAVTVPDFEVHAVKARVNYWSRLKEKSRRCP
jgi:serine/threonine protein phosphatase 1